MDPFHILDSIQSVHNSAERETVLSGQLLTVHEEGEHDVVLHRPVKWNAIVVSINAAEDDVTGGIFVCAGLLKKLLQGDTTPSRVPQAVAPRQCIYAHQRRHLIV